MIQSFFFFFNISVLIPSLLVLLYNNGPRDGEYITARSTEESLSRELPTYPVLRRTRVSRLEPRQQVTKQTSRCSLSVASAQKAHVDHTWGLPSFLTPRGPCPGEEQVGLQSDGSQCVIIITT